MVVGTYGGSLAVAELGLTRRWMEAEDLPRERVPEIVELIRVAYNGGPSWFGLGVPVEDHFTWKIFDPPGGGYVLLTLDDDDRIVGFTGAIRRIWLMHGEPHITRDGVDVCLHPDWQGRGVAKALEPYRGRDWHPAVEFNFGYETHPTLRRRAFERGIRGIANESHDFLLTLHPIREVSSRLTARVRARLGSRGGDEASEDGTPVSHTKIAIVSERVRSGSKIGRARHLVGQFGGPLWHYGRSMARRRPAADVPTVRIESIEQFDEGHSGFLAAASSQFDFIEERSLAFVNWRFCDKRAGPFFVRAAFEGDDMVGYAATRVLDGRAHLADVLALPGRTDVAEALIRDSVGIASRLGAATLKARLPRRHPYRSALQRAGLVDIGHIAGELIDPRNIDPAALDFLQDERTRVHLTFADSDDI